MACRWAIYGPGDILSPTKCITSSEKNATALGVTRVTPPNAEGTHSSKLGGGFKYFLMFTPILGEDSHFDSYFSNGSKPPTSQNL